jgi:hypothetical protein
MRPASLVFGGRSLSGWRECSSMAEWSAGRSAARAASRLRSLRRFRACHEANRPEFSVGSYWPTTVARFSANPGGRPCASVSGPRRRCVGGAARRRWTIWQTWRRRRCRHTCSVLCATSLLNLTEKADAGGARCPQRAWPDPWGWKCRAGSPSFAKPSAFAGTAMADKTERRPDPASSPEKWRHPAMPPYRNLALQKSRPPIGLRYAKVVGCCMIGPVITDPAELVARRIRARDPGGAGR